MKLDQCDLARIDNYFLNPDLTSDAQLDEHLEKCQRCRSYFDSQAAEPELWDEAKSLLRSTEFDIAPTAEFSRGGGSIQQVHRPLSIQSVLDALAPTDNPNGLGRIGIYEITGVIGAGAFGVVLKAIDPPLDRVVAIKVMASHLANIPSARKRFAREAKAAAAVMHPNVVPIHAVSKEDHPHPYLVMAYVRGGSLQKRLDIDGPLKTEEVLRIGSQIAAGLAAAHKQGLVHRDIKPENILLEEGVERAALTDFGLARAVDDSSMTQQGAIAGTPQYMSPEQARGQSVDQKSDLFSLGSVLYALCTGHPPFSGESSYGVMRRTIDDTATSIHDLNPDIPTWLCHIIEKLMSKDKSQRYATATEVHELLEGCLSHVQQPDAIELPDSLGEISGKNSIHSQPITKPKSFNTWIIGGLAMFAVTVIGISIAVFGTSLGLFPESPTQKVEAAYALAIEQLDPAGSPNNPAKAIETLLKYEEGIYFLRKLDEKFDNFAYDKKFSFSNESTGAIFVWNESENGSEKGALQQTLCRRFSKGPSSKGLSAKLPTQIQVKSVKIIRDKIVIDYQASNRAEDQAKLKKTFHLAPGTQHQASVNVIDLIENRVGNWVDLFVQSDPESNSQKSLLVSNKIGPVASSLKTLKAALDIYKLDQGGYPSTETGLEGLIKNDKKGSLPWRGPYLSNTKLISDPWGNQLRYEFPPKDLDNENVPKIWSIGPDQKENTEDDIQSWDKSTWDVAKVTGDAEKIQGYWQAISAEVDGKIVPQSELKELQVVIGKDSMSSPKGKISLICDYQIDSNQTPKQINMTQDQRKVLGIFDLDGDTLRICFAADSGTRPSSFDTQKNQSSGTISFHLKRIAGTNSDSVSGTDQLNADMAKLLVSAAAGMPNESLAKAMRLGKIKNQSLSCVLLMVNPIRDAKTNPDSVKDFEIIGGRLPKPTEIADAIWTSKWRGYASFIQPEYITDCQVKTDGKMATGTIAFEAKKLYRGKVQFTARMVDEHWRIEKLEMPNYGILVAIDKKGVWQKVQTDNPASGKSK